MTKQEANALLPKVDSAERTFHETEDGVSLTVSRRWMPDIMSHALAKYSR